MNALKRRIDGKVSRKVVDLIEEDRRGDDLSKSFLFWPLSGGDRSSNQLGVIMFHNCSVILTEIWHRTISDNKCFCLTYF